MSARSTTDAALLARLHDPNDLSAWLEFADIYQPRIYGICRLQRSGSQRLDEATAKGLTDAILLQLRQQMPSFHYDPRRGRFRGWLSVVVSNAVTSFFRCDRPQAMGGSDNQARMEQLPDPNASDLNALSDSLTMQLHKLPLRRMMLLQEAIERVKKKVRQPKRWEAFWEVLAEGKRKKEVAEDLDLSQAAVDVAVRELTRMLRKELQKKLNRLLADTRQHHASKELADYAGQTVDQLRQQGVRLLATLQQELETLLKELCDAATGVKLNSEAAKQLSMSQTDCAQAAGQLRKLVEAELNDLDSEESVSFTQA